MTLFVLTFFTIYGGMHLYAFLRARSALGFGPVVGTALALFMVFMTLTPFLIRGLERGGYELSARVLSYLGYLWLAALFLFLCASLLFDFYHLTLRGASLVLRGPLPGFRVAPFWTFSISLVLSLAICVFGFFDAQRIRTERLTMPTDKLPVGTDRLTIVQISDVHLGLIIRCDRLVAILEAVEAAKPDILVATGDIVDAQINHLHGLRELLQDLKPRYGKFAVTGNHEFYAGIATALEFIGQSGFAVLRGETRDVGGIQIAGVDDRTALQVNAGKPASDREALSRTDRSRKFVLFLKHQPHPDPDAIGLFDLMLSGHTHKGQIWPFRYLVQRAHPLLAGRYDVGKGSVVYTSRGTGTWGPPIRFLAPPEVTVIELVRTQS